MSAGASTRATARDLWAVTPSTADTGSNGTKCAPTSCPTSRDSSSRPLLVSRSSRRRATTRAWRKARKIPISMWSSGKGSTGWTEWRSASMPWHKRADRHNFLGHYREVVVRDDRVMRRPALPAPIIHYQFQPTRAPTRMATAWTTAILARPLEVLRIQVSIQCRRPP